MADFRKLFLVLVAGLLLLTTAASAAQYACTATAVPTLVRSEALADYVGDVLLTCVGDVPASGITANIRLTLGANITSQPLSSSLSEATLILNDGLGGFVGYDATSPLTPNPNGAQNVYQAARITATEVEWQGVVLAAPGSPGAGTIRLTNVRANAQGLGSGAPVSAVINITSPTSVPVTNNSLVVANIRQGLIFSVDDAAFKSCVGGGHVTITYKEGFGTAFRPKLSDAPSAVPHNIPGGGYQDESGFMPTPLASGSLVDASLIGAANQGTRFVSRIKSVPAGVTITAPGTVTDTNGMTIELVTGYSSTFSGGSLTSSDTEFTPDASGNVVLVYEVTSYNTSPFTAPSFTDTLNVQLDVDFTVQGTPGTATASGSFAPVCTGSSCPTASSSLPEPRFVETANDTDLFAINRCRTILLFPYLTNQADFDTGIAISNTTADPLSTDAQQGTCKLSYFGNTNNSTGPAAQTSPVVPSGGQLVFTLSGGGGVFAKDGGFTACATGACSAPAFQGYMFAMCDFQYAHGFEYVSNIRAPYLGAMGYLALVIPDRSGDRQPDPFSTAGSGTGEQLVQ